jgi:hypothetical protein
MQPSTIHSDGAPRCRRRLPPPEPARNSISWPVKKSLRMSRASAVGTATRSSASKSFGTAAAVWVDIRHSPFLFRVVEGSKNRAGEPALGAR